MTLETVAAKFEKLKLDKAYFWSKFELSGDLVGFLTTELVADEQNKLFFSCQRPSATSILRIFSPKPLPNGTVVSFAFQNRNTFELWSGEIASFLSRENDLDFYQLIHPRLEMERSERKSERMITPLSFALKTTGRVIKVLHFSGAELSREGLGLWIPTSSKDKIVPNREYELQIEGPAGEKLTTKVALARPFAFDSFTKGALVGFRFIQSADLPQITDLIERYGRLRESSEMAIGHYLAGFWLGEHLEIA
ncbi:MAG: hypothetical protein SFT81_00990 [Candidatus Caenarcaniphilales bacterium]|nr:hypothetical protein [Candidatus Caenarcaniphilales bacterium]